MCTLLNVVHMYCLCYINTPIIHNMNSAVISYVDPSCRDVADEIKAVIADESKTFERLFSRNKMLRRKIKMS